MLKKICKETATSHNGLTKLTYHYPEFDLWTIYDVYETPDGNQHLISDLGFCTPGRTLKHLYIDDETGKQLDYEDWGLTFDVMEASPTSITLTCSQFGGQQIGDLILESYSLFKLNKDVYTGEYTEEFINPLTDEPASENDSDILILRNESNIINITFSPLHSALTAGNYVIYLSIQDEYEKAQVHPLMKNYYDKQDYCIQFSIE